MRPRCGRHVIWCGLLRSSCTVCDNGNCSSQQTRWQANSSNYGPAGMNLPLWTSYGSLRCGISGNMSAQHHHGTGQRSELPSSTTTAASVLRTCDRDNSLQQLNCAGTSPHTYFHPYIISSPLVRGPGNNSNQGNHDSSPTKNNAVIAYQSRATTHYPVQQ